MAQRLRLGPQMINTSGEHNAFYRRTLQVLAEERLPFLIGGAFAVDYLLGTSRQTKDLDLFVTPEDVPAILETLGMAGYRVEITDPQWLGKAFCGHDFVDIIFGFGNGITKIDGSWFPDAVKGELWGVEALFCPLEESLWSKAFVMERDRFDGADVAHIILLKGPELDWRRILGRFGPHWRVLLAHLTLFGFVYPGRRDRVPEWVLRELIGRLSGDLEPSPDSETCFGPYLSRTQYVYDLERLGMVDARER
ncbi:MAG: hypothetical protein JOZ39_10990 [Chloroflexi bacterium]|nr:hypothetical protein [Chloroflexota bacterium]